MTSLPGFLPVVAEWFAEAFAEPTHPQREGWASIAQGHHTLIVAPTGSGKTLAAFLWGVNHLLRLGLEGTLEEKVYLLYISPLKALNNDIEKNLRGPLHAIRERAAQQGQRLPEIRLAVRTGDTLAHAPVRRGSPALCFSATILPDRNRQGGWPCRRRQPKRKGRRNPAKQ